MSLAGSLVLVAWAVVILGFALVVANWDYHPQVHQDLVDIQRREIQEKVVQLDEFLSRLQAQRDPAKPELVVELGVNTPVTAPDRRAA